MNKIKGLILKDLLELKTYKKNFLLSIIIYMFIIVFNKNEMEMPLIATTMIMFLCSIYAIATFNYDEKHQTDKYVLTFGVTRKDVIISKYILHFLGIAVGAVIGIIIVIALYLTNMIKEIDFAEYFISLLTSIYALNLLGNIQIPFIYKYGAEKGRLQIYIVMMIMISIICLLAFCFPKISLDFLTSIEAYIPIILVLLIIINTYISYRISKKFYIKKDL